MAGGTSDIKNEAGVPLIEGFVESLTGSALVLRLPGTNYRPHLVASAALPVNTGSKVVGIVRCQARRIDVVAAGGRFVEPCFGRPRRIQGRVIGVSASANEVHVRAGFAVVATPMAPQKASDFEIGQMVSFDAEPGASFAPSAPAHH